MENRYEKFVLDGLNAIRGGDYDDDGDDLPHWFSCHDSY